MTNNEQKKNLLHNMSNEQESYRYWLMNQTPPEILRYAEEYQMRNDIIEAMQTLPLSKEQIEVLSISPTPLSDMCDAYLSNAQGRLQDIRTYLIHRADSMIRDRNHILSTPIYPFPYNLAAERNELQSYNASRRANIECKNAIEDAIAQHYHDNLLHDCIEQMISQFGAQRVQYVLTNSIQHILWDGRIPPNNKEWANQTIICKDVDSYGYDKNLAFAISKSHPGVLDLFVSQYRRYIDSSRTSIRARLSQTSPPKVAKHTKKEREL